jgi:hypothetical protein
MFDTGRSQVTRHTLILHHTTTFPLSTDWLDKVLKGNGNINFFKVCSFTATRYINHVSLATLV